MRSAEERKEDRGTTIHESVNSGMFQEPIHNASCPNILTEVRQPWAHATDTPDDEVDSDPGLARIVEEVDHSLILQAVHLEGQTGDAPCLGVGHFLPDTLGNSLSERRRSHEKMITDWLFDFLPEEAKDLFQIFRQAWIGGEERVIGIDPGGGLVEVPGSKVAIVPTTSASSLVTRAIFGVNLDPGLAIGDPDPRLLHLSCPFEVPGLVEPGLHLDERRTPEPPSAPLR